jgi:thiosulfate/3-mercaptopyruvate sulfurtransferase
MASPIIDPSVLQSGAVLIDARSGPTGADVYREAHLAGARHVDLETELSGDHSDPSRGGRHPLPTLEAWSTTLGRLGIEPDSEVVVYDDKGGANAASRFWWMLRAVGHERVHVLDGGWAAALAADLPTESGTPSPAPTAPYLVPDTWLRPVVNIDEVASRAEDDAWKVLDVRAAERYRGETEPLDPVAGHIPGADNLFFEDNLGPDGRFLSADALREKYRALLGGRAPDHLIVSCGSGVTACHTLLALEAAGIDGAKLYVGSWSEWCRSDRPKAKG